MRVLAVGITVLSVGSLLSEARAAKSTPIQESVDAPTPVKRKVRIKRDADTDPEGVRENSGGGFKPKASAAGEPRRKKTLDRAPDDTGNILSKPKTVEGSEAQIPGGVGGPGGGTPPEPQASMNASVGSEEILEFRAQPAGVKTLIEYCLALTAQNLTYTFGSADPAGGGMDCSGFVYFVLRQHGLAQVPRDSSSLYTWVRKARNFRAVLSRKPDSFELDEMLPGDLLFWMGTYDTPNDPPISHVMIYLGTEKSTGQRIMVGSSDGRTYRGLKRNGVSVFDFQMPRASKAGETVRSFVGYARVPGLRD